MTGPVSKSRSCQSILRASTTSRKPSWPFATPLPLESPDRYAAHLLATIMGDHTGSRLYWTLIDPGLADGAELSYQDYNHAGAFFSFLSCEPSSAQENLDLIAQVYRDAIANGVTEEELGQGGERTRCARPVEFCEASARWADWPRSVSTGCTGTPYLSG